MAADDLQHSEGSGAEQTQEVLATIVADDSPWRLDIGGRPAWAECDGLSGPRAISFRLSLENLWKFTESSIGAGSTIRAEVAHESGLYTADMETEELLSAGKELLLRARIKGGGSCLQRRDAMRVRLLLDARVRQGEQKDDRQYEALVRDLSESGLRMSVSSPHLQVEAGDHVIVIFSTPSIGELKTDAEVKWRRSRIKGCELGIHFAELSSEQSMRLRRYVADVRRSRAEGA